jgi:redox-sensitive bicupin YhaK (pirin superfamily)
MISLRGHEKDLGGGFRVRRLLPAAARQSVGPFIFFDHFGPVHATPGDEHDVRPHPHIGLATVTYLFEGAMLHRDSLGSVQRIEPGAINWMTAGRGIVHSERTPDDLRDVARTSHGLQLWAALPAAFEESEPSFHHTPASALPEHALASGRLRVLIGSYRIGADMLRSPVETFAETLYLDLALDANARFELNADTAERAIYCVDRAIQINGADAAPFELHVLEPGQVATLAAPDGARLAVIGGAPLDGHRAMWWNFVSTRRERIVQAADDWSAGRFPTVPGETEFIPLPPTRPPGSA